MRRQIVLLSAAALWAVGQPADLRVAGATSTQIVFSYQAPVSDEPCSVAAENLADADVTVYDLDFTKFPGSPAVNSDFRHPWNVGTRSRFFVLGKKTSDAGPDGKLYSRALEAATAHRITVTCGGNTASVDANTRNLPASATFPELPPANEAGLGHYAWPSVDWTNRSRPLIDPMTGVKIKFATFPGDYANTSNGLFSPELWVDWSGGFWADPQNVASGTTAALASYSSFGNEALFVAVDPDQSVFKRLTGGWGAENPYSFDDFGVHVIGMGTDGNAANRTVSVCLSIDSGQSCHTDSIQVVLPQNNPADMGVQPPNFPTPIFGGWGKIVLRSQLGTQGTGNVSGNALTLTSPTNGNTLFNPDLPAGSKVRIPGSAPACDHGLCTVERIVDGTHLTLVESLPGPLTGVNFTIANFGVRIVKTTAVGAVGVSVKYENAWSFGAFMPFTGATEMCSQVPVQSGVNADGQALPNGQMLTGYNCTINGRWYWISTDTGEARLISLTVPPPVSAFSGVPANDIPNPGQAAPGIAAFDLTQGNVGYTFASLQGGGKAIFKLTYTGDYRALRYDYPFGGFGQQPNNVEQNMTWTNLTPVSQGKDLATQIQQRVPAYDANRFGEVTDFYGISGQFAMFLKALGGQDTPCWVFLYNLDSQSLEFGFNSWDGSFHPLSRWSACHTAQAGVPPNTAFLNIKPLYARSTNLHYGGPFTTTLTHVLRVGGVYDTNTALAANPDGSYEATCPAGLPPQYSSLTGTNQCVTFRVAGEACSEFATANEKIWSPCPTDPNKSMLQEMAVGDSLANPDVGIDSERYVILKKTVLSPTSIELAVLRNQRTDCGTLAFQRVNANGWRVMMEPNGDTCEVGEWVVDAPTRQLFEEFPRIVRGHFDFAAGTTPSTFTIIGQGFNGPLWSYLIRDNTTVAQIGQPADRFVTMDRRFSNVAGANFGVLQSYVSKHQWTSQGPERRWALDFRHLNGGFGFFMESQLTSIGPITATLVPGTAQVYQISILGGADVKKIPLLGFAGRYLLREKSSTVMGDTLTDADSYRFCYAYRAGECRASSAAGQAFVSLPSASITGQCQTGQFGRNIPCLMTNHPLGAWAIQFDASQNDLDGSSIRRLSMALTGPGRQYAFGNLRALPDGKWAMMSGSWLDGVSTEVLLVKLPPYGQTDSVNRQEFGAWPVDIYPQAGATRAIIDFGYGEHGEAADFYCTPRAEACTVSDAMVNYATPFQYASEAGTGQACSPKCVIRIPVIPARVFYFRVRHLDGSGQTVYAEPVRVGVSQ